MASFANWLGLALTFVLIAVMAAVKIAVVAALAPGGNVLHCKRAFLARQSRVPAAAEIGKHLARAAVGVAARGGVGGSLVHDVG